METGRSRPSRDMVLRLAELLEVPLRERNTLLVAAGFAPMFRESGFDDPQLQAAREAVDLVLKGHEPYPALAVDRHWTLLAHNRAIAPLLVGVDAQMLAPPLNVLRLSLHPLGLAPRIVNLAEWRDHLFARLRRQIEISADPVLTNCSRSSPVIPRRPTHRLALQNRRCRNRSSCRSSSRPTPACSASSARPPSSAHRSTSLCQNWRWKSFFPADAHYRGGPAPAARMNSVYRVDGNTASRVHSPRAPGDRCSTAAHLIAGCMGRCAHSHA